MTLAASCHAHEGWLLTPEGAAIRPEEAAAVVADVHLGYEWARGEAGDCVPAHSLAETVDRLTRVLARAPIRRLIVAGDLVESQRPCAATAADVFRLGDWLRSREVDFVVVPGNHDRSLPWTRSAPRSSSSGPIVAGPELNLAGWTICHGHRPSQGDRVLMGHHHPALVVDRFAAPCFLVGDRLVVLPAFSPNAAGRDVSTAAGGRPWRNLDLKCVAAAGAELLDFGPVATLAARVKRKPPASASRP